MTPSRVGQQQEKSSRQAEGRNLLGLKSQNRPLGFTAKPPLAYPGVLLSPAQGRSSSNASWPVAPLSGQRWAALGSQAEVAACAWRSWSMRARGHVDLQEARVAWRGGGRGVAW